MKLSKRPSNLNGFVLSPKEETEEKAVNKIKLPARFQKYVHSEKSTYTPWSPTRKFVFPAHSLPPELSPESDAKSANTLPSQFKSKSAVKDDQNTHHHVRFQDTAFYDRSLDYNANKPSEISQSVNNIDDQKFMDKESGNSCRFPDKPDPIGTNISLTPSVGSANMTSPCSESPEEHQKSDIQTAIDWLRQEVVS